MYAYDVMVTYIPATLYLKSLNVIINYDSKYEVKVNLKNVLLYSVV